MTTTSTAPAGPLSSDHVNYLILRYLQEAGHEASATAFYRDWRRPAEYRDPEDLPFAHSVQRHELVSVIHDGLYHDELSSRVRKEGRRYNFTTNGPASGSRPGTAGKGKERLDQIRRGTEDFPTPPPKRQRKSEEDAHDRQINGAAEPMEIDAASPSAGDAEDEAEASPAAQTPEPEVIDFHERYDSMDVAVQTESKTGPKTSTLYWRLSEPDATILHNAFSPAEGSQTLFTAGEGVSQLYDVPSDIDSGIDKISHLDDISTSASSVVTACAWRPDGHELAFAVDFVRDIGIGGKQERRQAIKSHNVTHSRTTEYHSPPLLEPPGIVMALRYNVDGSHLLAIRTNGSRGTVEVWNTNSAGNTIEVTGWHVFEGLALDATWIAPTEFVVCGAGALIQKFRVTPAQNGTYSDAEHNSQSARTRGVEVSTRLNIPQQVQYLSLDKLRATVLERGSAGPSGVSFVILASQDGTLVHGFADSKHTRLVSLGSEGTRVTALAFPTLSDEMHTKSALPGNNVLAVAREDGRFVVHQIHRYGKPQTQAVSSLADGSPALALAWSPTGSHLAVSGVDVVQIWETLPLVNPDQRNQHTRALVPEPIVTWRREKSAALKELRNGERAAANGAAGGEGEESLLEPSLSWSADGESLALAVGKEVRQIPDKDS